MKKFNIAGPMKENKHYVIPPLSRLDLKEVLEHIDDEKYFIMHAPRQSGKTSSLLALQKYINERNDYVAIYINVECGQASRNNFEKGIKDILNELKSRAIKVLGHKEEIKRIYKEISDNQSFGYALNEFIQELCQLSEKPLVLFIDEIDSLIGDTLIAVLRQLRSGYDMRPEYFPQSIILCGIVDIKDYKIHRSNDDIITGGSCFNIKSESFRLGNFSKKQIIVLYNAHTQETDQIFESNVFDLAWEYTAGQPWLVNALAYEACFKMRENRDRSIPITAELFEQAKENLILSRVTHLDQLADKLNEDRVRRVIEPMLIGDNSLATYDDQQYCIDLGLIKKTEKGLTISNAIYKEVFPRELTASLQQNFLSAFSPEWVNEDNSINTNKLMTLFQQFWRENSEIWSSHIAGYHEAAPHLVFHGFLQRVSNGYGIIEREYGLHRKRTDIYLRWNAPMGQQRIVFELKIRTERENTSEKFEKLKTESLKQITEYADICGANESHLVIFDRRQDMRWDEKIYSRTSEYEGYKINIWGA
ncbi:protein containing DUF1703 [Candidatus Magnetomorum sp. HK-1]|nr:protein containing DUF1703 [Candidatus Magnetomorum sp. HK-1]